MERDKKYRPTALSRNRERLADQIYRMDGSFTCDELFEIHKTSCAEASENTIAIGGIQTVGGFLKQLREIGVLEKELGRYWVR